jgi:hypothetical protein
MLVLFVGVKQVANSWSNFQDVAFPECVPEQTIAPPDLGSIYAGFFFLKVLPPFLFN